MRPRAFGGPVVAVLLTLAAIVASMVFRAGNVILAAEGIAILGCLLGATAPPGLRGKNRDRWIRSQLPPLAAYLAAVPR